MITEFDKRQIILLKNQLEYYEKNTMDLGALVSRIEALLGAMEDVDKLWKDKIYQFWIDLEVIYACNVNTDEPIHELDRIGLNNALQSLQTLVTEFIRENNIDQES